MVMAACYDGQDLLLSSDDAVVVAYSMQSRQSRLIQKGRRVYRRTKDALHRSFSHDAMMRTKLIIAILKMYIYIP